MWKHILSGAVAAILRWILIAIFALLFNGMSLEVAVALWVGMFLACEMVILANFIFAKIEHRK